MNGEIIDRPLIDPNLDSYEQFFDSDWCMRMFEAVKTSPLNDALCTLMVAWRYTNGAHMLPRLMAHSLKGFAENESNGSLRFRADYSGEVVKGLVGKLESKMHHSLNINQRATLKRVVSKIEQEAHDAFKTARSKIEFPLEGYWRLLTRTSEFQFSILGIQRINYGSLIFAYEDFLANGIRTKEPTYSSKKEPIKEAFARLFGATLRDFCWTDTEVELAMLVRHALVSLKNLHRMPPRRQQLGIKRGWPSVLKDRLEVEPRDIQWPLSYRHEFDLRSRQGSWQSKI